MGEVFVNTRDETRTRKALRPGDFESPASTDSATRACHQFSSESGVVLPYAFSLGWRPTHPTATTTRILTRELVCPVPELCLQREISCALYRREKGCKLLLLGFDQCDALLLQANRRVEQCAHPGLVRLGGHQLLTELPTAAPLIHHDRR